MQYRPEGASTGPVVHLSENKHAPPPRQAEEGRATRQDLIGTLPEVQPMAALASAANLAVVVAISSPLPMACNMFQAEVRAWAQPPIRAG